MRLVEALCWGMVAQMLRAYKDYRGICDDLYYWAPSDRSAIEVDFILVRGSDLIAVEAKSGATFADTWCRSLRAIAQIKGVIRRIIVYPRGPEMRTRDGIDVLPFKHFADELAGNALWNEKS